MIEHASTPWRLGAAVAEVDGRTVAVAGPSGVGKTAVLLALIARGARPVAFERAEITADGLAVHEDNVRIRARHLPLLHDAVRLSRSQRTWLRLGAVGSRLPFLGARIGRRCFVDVAPGAVRSRATGARVDLLVVLDPDTHDGPRPADAADLVPYLGRDVEAPLAFVLGTGGRSGEDVADAVRALIRQC